MYIHKELMLIYLNTLGHRRHRTDNSDFRSCRIRNRKWNITGTSPDRGCLKRRTAVPAPELERKPRTNMKCSQITDKVKIRRTAVQEP